MVLINNSLQLASMNLLKIICCLLLVNLSGCVDNDVSDLSQYINTIKVRPKGAIKPLPEIKIVEPFIFNPEGLRDPFRPVEKRANIDNLNNIGSNSGIHPNTSRRKEELENYSLDTLRMVGTLTINNGLWALIKASDGTIHRVRKGNHIGLNYGEISRISADKIELIEIVPDTPGAWRKQPASIVLAEAE